MAYITAYITALTQRLDHFCFVGMSAHVVIGTNDLEFCAGYQFYQITPDQQLHLFDLVGGLKRLCIPLIAFAVPGAEDRIFGFDYSSLSKREVLVATEACDPTEGAECDQPEGDKHSFHEHQCNTRIKEFREFVVFGEFGEYAVLQWLDVNGVLLHLFG